MRAILISFFTIIASFSAVNAQHAVTSSYASGNGYEFSFGETFIGNIGTSQSLMAGMLQGEIILSSGIEDVSNDCDNHFKLYPNPVCDVLNIEFSGKIDGDMKLFLFDNSGKVTLSHKISSSKETLNTTAIPAGVYIVKITSINSKDYISTNKLIKK